MSGPEYDRVTTDPVVEAELIARLRAGAPPEEVVAHAFGHGLRPRDWTEGDPMPGLDLVWPHDSEDEILMWHPPV
ncbi:hypothetical protein LX16_2960 [Stackebrandtia albiflava]|uniref:Uncharacterized protein n=1 Tax=Stackebrandtia albiflava TaxID=406432 RepID=A0A562V2X1_9ACTN|nr:hypothetical protein [Stackebrandtia albiflava]TWJ12205.1 hypothetical protein LX16_2960 [Stackebrandtia albiflava]